MVWLRFLLMLSVPLAAGSGCGTTIPTTFEFPITSTMVHYSGKSLGHRVFLEDPIVELVPDDPRDSVRSRYYAEQSKKNIKRYLKKRLRQMRVLGTFVEDRSRADWIVTLKASIKHTSPPASTGKRVAAGTMLTLLAVGVVGGPIIGAATDNWAVGGGIIGGGVGIPLLWVFGYAMPFGTYTAGTTGRMTLAVRSVDGQDVFSGSEDWKKTEELRSMGSSRNPMEHQPLEFLDQATAQLADRLVRQTKPVVVKPKTVNNRLSFALLGPAPGAKQDPLLAFTDDQIKTHLSQCHVVSLVGAGEQRAALALIRDSYKQCYDEKCQIDLVKKVKASHLVQWSFKQKGGKCKLSLRLYRFTAQGRELLGSAEESARCGAEALSRMVRTAVTNSLGKQCSR